MRQRGSEIFAGFLLRVLRSLATLCLRHSMRIQDITECAKQALLQAAEDELVRSGQGVTTSRLSVMTGIHRKDVERLRVRGEVRGASSHMIVKIVGQWQLDRRFVTADGRPKCLDLGGKASSFNRLVRSVSKEMNPATVLFELERSGTARKSAKGLELQLGAYSPSDNLEQGFQVLADDVQDLIAGVSGNLANEHNIPNLHARTVFDNVRPDRIQEIRQWLVREGHEFHRRAREYISQADQDINPEPGLKGPAQKVVLGSFSRITAK